VPWRRAAPSPLTQRSETDTALGDTALGDIVREETALTARGLGASDANGPELQTLP